MSRLVVKLPFIVLTLTALWLANVGMARGQLAPSCGTLAHSGGTYDYRTAPSKIRNLVEGAHFTEAVATLNKGSSNVNIGGDIAYTLRWFPNHPRALMAMTELARRERKDPPPGSPYTVQCWFERAIAFRPDDPNVRTVYGIALLRDGHRAQAIEQLSKAVALAPEEPNAHYNLGLAYFGEKQYDRARVEAKSAYALGFPLPGLRDMLEKEHQWQ